MTKRIDSFFLRLFRALDRIDQFVSRHDRPLPNLIDCMTHVYPTN